VAAYAAAALVLLAAAYLVVISPLRSYTDGGGDRATPSATGGPATTAASSTNPGTPGPEPTRSPATASGVPMPVGDQPGWRQVLVDDFAGTALDEDIWFRYEGQPSGDPGGWFDPSHVSVGDGKLVIGGWQEPARDNLYVTGGVSTHDRHAQTYGRYQVRFRVDQGTGIAYVLLLWPTNNQYPPEIDFAEDNGRDRQTIYGVLHPPDQAAYPNEEYTVKADATQWHTAGLEWTPERLVYTLDGEPWATVEGPQVPGEPMDLALQTQAWYCGQGWEACPDETTPDRVDLEVDWVSIHAYQP
jgi:beta-glucanase (GH16 family)